MGRSVGVGRGGVRVVRFFLAGEEDAAVWGLELGSWAPAASSGPTTRTSWAKKVGGKLDSREDSGRRDSKCVCFDRPEQTLFYSFVFE